MKFGVTSNRQIDAPVKCSNGAYRLTWRAKLSEPMKVRVADGEKSVEWVRLTLFTETKLDPAKIAGRGFDVEASKGEFKDWRVQRLIRNKKLDSDLSEMLGEPEIKLD